MYWKLKVSGYGKIEHAEIEVAPLILFVGDNNSGKSYLMSLLWGIQNLGTTEMMKAMDEGSAEEILAGWFKKQMAILWEQETCIVNVGEILDVLQFVLDKGLGLNKENLLKKIFNSTDVKIEDLRIELVNTDKVFLTFKRTSNVVDGRKDIFFMGSSAGMEFRFSFEDKSHDEIENYFSKYMVKCMLVSLATGIGTGGAEDLGSHMYLPAARTGFMLTKNIINKVGRDTAFNMGVGQREVTPFTRLINQFLDVMNELTFDSMGNVKFDNIITYLERGMAEGAIKMSTMPNREVMYVPEGLESGMPLRVVSAVVTELSPLILILKHKWNLDTLFYEEPEMCLHPQLQQKMARVICQLVNAGLKMVITTHSDIILQHINNMIRLPGRENVGEICQRFGYQEADLMKAGNVKVYQLKSGAGVRTKVEEVACGENGFAVPTFNEALDRIMDEAYSIQE